MKDMLSIKEFAEACGCSVPTVRRWIRGDRVQASRQLGKFGPQYFIHRSQLNRVEHPQVEDPLRRAQQDSGYYKARFEQSQSRCRRLEAELEKRPEVGEWNELRHLLHRREQQLRQLVQQYEELAAAYQNLERAYEEVTEAPVQESPNSTTVAKGWFDWLPRLSLLEK